MKMNSKVKANLQSIKTSLKDSKKKVDKKIQAKPQKTSTNSGCLEKDRKMALEHDIEELTKQLAHEEGVRTALEQALNRPLGTLPCLPPYLPPETSELLSEALVLEEDVFRLEEEVTQFRQDLYEEAIHISFFKKNLENSSHFQEKDPTRDTKTTNAALKKHKSPNLKLQIAETLSKRYQIDYCSTDTCLDSRKQQFEDVGITTFAVQEKGILGDDSPNKISESVLK
ncbi:ternary complex factor MIP1 protein, partial [Tanacetum coccineum]